MGTSFSSCSPLSWRLWHGCIPQSQGTHLPELLTAWSFLKHFLGSAPRPILSPDLLILLARFTFSLRLLPGLASLLHLPLPLGHLTQAQAIDAIGLLVTHTHMWTLGLTFPQCHTQIFCQWMSQRFLKINEARTGLSISPTFYPSALPLCNGHHHLPTLAQAPSVGLDSSSHSHECYEVGAFRDTEAA